VKRRVRPSFYLDVAKEELWLLENAGSETADRWHEYFGKQSNLWKVIPSLVASDKIWSTLAFAPGESKALNGG
jgi:hypothetical protein